MSAVDLLRRLRHRWLLLRCKGSVDYLSERSAIALNLIPASGLGIGAVDHRHLSIFKCGERRERCEACPRFQSYRKIIGTNEQRRQKLNMSLASQDGKSDGSNRDSEVAEVDDLNGNIRSAGGINGIGRYDARPQSVKAPCAPRIEATTRGAQKCNCESDSLSNTRIHVVSTSDDSTAQRYHSGRTVDLGQVPPKPAPCPKGGAA